MWLNKKAKKEFLNRISKLFDADTSELEDFEFFVSGKKIYIAASDLKKINLNKFKVVSIGNYFAKKENGLRLSIEGSQIIGPKALKNVLEIDKKELKSWLSGEDLPKESKTTGIFLIKFDKDFFGSGKITGKKILNYVPKARRVKLEI